MGVLILRIISEYVSPLVIKTFNWMIPFNPKHIDMLSG